MNFIVKLFCKLKIHMYIIISLLIIYSYGTRAALTKWYNRCVGERF